MNQFYKNLALWLVISLMMILLFNLINKPKPSQEKLDYSDFIESVETGKIKNVDKRVASVTIQGNEIIGKFADGKEFRSYKPADAKLTDLLLAKKIPVNARPEEEKFSWFSIFISWFPIIFLVGVWIFFMRQMQGGGGKAMAFGKSRAKLLTEAQGRVTFEDVAGIEEAKEELEEIISFLKEPKKFTKLGGRIPKGVLLMGPPGTGKTLLARAIAGEAGVPFFSISGSDFVEMFVGVGASRVRDLFVQGKKSAPCIIFIDEIDAVGRHRGAGLGGGHDEREQTLNQLLVEMDGFESNEGVILIAATNRPDVLDPALLRPGRFDRQVVVPRPDVKGREAILKVHTKKTPLGPNIDLAVIARGTPGFSGADLSNVVNEAALLAARKDKSVVDMQDFDDAKDKVLMGVERRSMVISDEEKKNTAYHEAGHTLVAKLIPGTDPVHKVSIIPRGRALGVTMQLPIEDKHSYSRESLLDRIAVLLGGRVAEEIIFSSMTTGAGNDIERATEIARKMICEWGMSEKLGPVSFGKKDEQIFLGREMSTHKNYSEATAVEIDVEIRRIIDDNYGRVYKLLSDNIDTLHKLSLELIEKENLSGDEVDRIIRSDAPVQATPEVTPA
ncbi:cell division ATP-dependent zinc protease FtsH [Geotalea daltonii FRC-32]|uniref:ATP-dependent zinc metalloprotease FtsH n=1 Tax=Geotalea daltonii (strain DSM 22248 / JCM 15807 / FRC-32) TaxID=316067 RepID=B9M5K7_GEODF|nr:ATP-dependent zinc metalloprotease FtsH [Geotalea daltonii]ACM21766.1 cell division ATP-dependent zinc protease FtsH [Geotalea daltonii FRC-32]